MAKTKTFSNFQAISFVFWANILIGLWDPLGCSNLSQLFFGSSPTVGIFFLLSGLNIYLPLVDDGCTCRDLACGVFRAQPVHKNTRDIVFCSNRVTIHHSHFNLQCDDQTVKTTVYYESLSGESRK